jgi:methanogenic corrinoid protein MtbC1
VSYAARVYTIKRAAELTGVPAATLRAWERRYGLGQPIRSESGYRLYDERSLADIRAMQLLLDSGWAPRQAAAQVIRLTGQVGTVLPPASASPNAQSDLERSRATEAFISAAVAMDDFAMRRALDAGFGRAAFEEAFDHWLAPALRALGEAWVDGKLDIAAEHFASAAVMRRLSAAYESAAIVQGSSRVLVGLGPGAFHELGAIGFAAAARRTGLGAIYLGPDLPESAWLNALRQEHAHAVVLSVITDAEVATVRPLIARIASEHPSVLIAVGGPHAAVLSDIATVLHHGISDSVAQLRAGLRPRSIST